MTPIRCVGRDERERAFQYRCEFDDLDNTWDFEVHTIPPLTSGGAFEFQVKVLDDGSLQSVWMGYHGAQEFSAKGVSDAIILEAARFIGSPIFSSPAFGGPGESRQPGTRKVWQRLIDRGLASYDPATDTYRTL